MTAGQDAQRGHFERTPDRGFCLNCSTQPDPDPRRVHDVADCPWRPEPAVPRWDAIDAAHLERQRAWSRETFGPGDRAKGVVDHIRKELAEIEADPGDLGEWVDVVILALDGAWRSGAEPEQIIAAIKAKQARNEARVWPDWRTQSADRAIEHDRSHDGVLAEALRELHPGIEL